jgi:hypothetical protein
VIGIEAMRITAGVVPFEEALSLRMGIEVRAVAIAECDSRLSRGHGSEQAETD